MSALMEQVQKFKLDVSGKTFQKKWYISLE